MSNELIDIKSINELSGMKFFIPSYQRGYRWTKQHVNDLLNDINEFSIYKSHDSNEYYCLQPLVVVKSKDSNTLLNEIKEKAKSIEEVRNLLKGQWDVIDGQQRLTTIYLILKAIANINQYELDYETRDKSKDFLKELSEKSDVNDENIDFYHMSLAYECINEWKEKIENKEQLSQFKEILLNRVKFIWYESSGEDPIKVFTRLNIGKIPLTNAELIKALILNSSNFKDSDTNHLRLQQQEIASEWDDVEYRLHDDEFWLFLHNPKYDRPTRIDFIFDLIVDKNSLGISQESYEKIGTDEYRTFRYFYEYFSDIENKNEVGVIKCWAEVKKYFQTFIEWYNDIEIYHYIGYLIEYNQKLNTLIDDWTASENKAEFIKKLKEEINKVITRNGVNDLNLFYDTKGGPQKTNCKRILLLHNIQTVINQAKIANEKYKHSVFYKFPFHLYKLEQWDVEHIDSNTENHLEDKNSQNEFLLNIYLSVNESTQKKIAEFINKPEADNFYADFESFLKTPENALSDKEENNEKNQIWNFTLLDSNTNRSYGNAIYSAKRRIIISKDQGKFLSMPKIKKVDGKTQLEYNNNLTDAESAFVPPCTKHVFMKYYSPVSSEPNYWLKPDATAYRNDIMKILKDAEFEVIDSISDNKTK